ncbi:MFS transporter [Streptomyces sp. ISL-100]|uniref:MFS transporter n=1 Tax=Streptomyces sp. ISL-100 TaxID=2819173 RepID=UPI001BE81E63|nr:MFS transporter [Streptomyces sp. ISL-100]
MGVFSLAVAALLAVLVPVTGHFAAYTYVRPALERVPDIGAGLISGLLLVYGTAGIAGNFLGGAAAARDPRRTLLVISAVLGVTVLLAAGVGGGSAVAAAALLVVWGLAYGGVSVSAQNWLMAAAPTRREAASALFAGVFNAAIALGALLGGRAADRYGVPGPLWLGGALALVGMVAVVAAGRTRTTVGRDSAESRPTTRDDVEDLDDLDDLDDVTERVRP